MAKKGVDRRLEQGVKEHFPTLSNTPRLNIPVVRESSISGYQHNKTPAFQATRTGLD